MLKGKKIVLGITGGIAAYKAAELTRALVKEGAQVRVIMTKNATEFISPLTLQTLSNNIVHTEMYLPSEQYDMAHITLADFADTFVIAPATGNIIGKIASGIADDLLSDTVMAAHKPTLICPAMNDKMLTNPIVQENIKKLKNNKYVIMESGVGELACKTRGAGRLRVRRSSAQLPSWGLITAWISAVSTFSAVTKATPVSVMAGTGRPAILAIATLTVR